MGNGFACGCSGRLKRALQPHGVVVKKLVYMITIQSSAILTVVIGLVSFVLAMLSALFTPKRFSPQGLDWGELVDRAGAAFSAFVGVLLGTIAILLVVISWFINHQVAYGFFLGDVAAFGLIYLLKERK
jgi:hypothetical protein